MNKRTYYVIGVGATTLLVGLLLGGAWHSQATAEQPANASKVFEKPMKHVVANADFSIEVPKYEVTVDGHVLRMYQATIPVEDLQAYRQDLPDTLTDKQVALIAQFASGASVDVKTAYAQLDKKRIELW